MWLRWMKISASLRIQRLVRLPRVWYPRSVSIIQRFPRLRAGTVPRRELGDTTVSKYHLLIAHIRALTLLLSFPFPMSHSANPHSIVCSNARKPSIGVLQGTVSPVQIEPSRCAKSVSHTFKHARICRLPCITSPIPCSQAIHPLNHLSRPPGFYSRLQYLVGHKLASISRHRDVVFRLTKRGRVAIRRDTKKRSVLSSSNRISRTHLTYLSPTLFLHNHNTFPSAATPLALETSRRPCARKSSPFSLPWLQEASVGSIQ